jgi:hypothetical protein
VIAVLAGTGDDNFGDEWMAEALEAGLPSCRLAEITYPATERRLARLALSGPRLFSGIVVSGGTLINSYFLPRILPLIGTGIPAWAVGTGVGSAGFGVTESSAAPDGWVGPLKAFEEVAVRGPRSVARLQAAGFRKALAVGDLALAHTPDKPVTTHGSRRMLVNLSGTELEIAQGEGMPETLVLETVASALRELARSGWALVPLAMHRDDLPRLQAVGRMVGGWTGDVVVPKTSADARYAMNEAGAVIGMRLHAAALGWIHGVPTLGLAYRDKTLDFAEQIGAEDQVVDLRTVSTPQLVATINAFPGRSAGRAYAVHRRALSCRAALLETMARIDAQLRRRDR